MTTYFDQQDQHVDVDASNCGATRQRLGAAHRRFLSNQTIFFQRGPV
jgi:hypothetical protein